MILETGLPKSVMDHLAECAEEMGEEFPTPISNKRKISYKGRTISLVSSIPIIPIPIC